MFTPWIYQFLTSHHSITYPLPGYVRSIMITSAWNQLLVSLHLEVACDFIRSQYHPVLVQVQVCHRRDHRTSDRPLGDSGGLYDLSSVWNESSALSCHQMIIFGWSRSLINQFDILSHGACCPHALLNLQEILQGFIEPAPASSHFISHPFLALSLLLTFSICLLRRGEHIHQTPYTLPCSLSFALPPPVFSVKYLRKCSFCRPQK